ncbi:MAG: 4Fe-4S dicluster domain-containing protein [Planctomycetota bacterium]
MSEEPENSPHDRRQMFRLGLKQLMVPLANFIEDRFDVSLPIDRRVLRPPGALPENEFQDTCYRCGNCVDVCPARAIRVLSSEDIDMSGTPYIDPDLSACVVCDELSCMSACPSGALVKLEDRRQISMGIARVDKKLCIRSAGQDCRICIEKCPMCSDAIGLSEAGAIEVKEAGCVGCGSCQFFCPTRGKAIMVAAL